MKQSLEQPKNKYYTPDISEFYVGFEYEAFEPEDQSGVGKYKKYVFNRDDCAVKYYKFNSHDYRVKYLDSEDIESLGFWCRNDGDEANFQSKNNDGDFYEIDIYDNILSIEKFVQVAINTHNSYTIFKGKVKNKSELKILLNQLGISYE